MTYDIFISYRRQGGYATAKHLYDLLTRDGYNVSFDIDTLRNGDFDTELLTRIDECTDFILILNDTAFDRCIDPNFDRKHDWLRNELAYALEKGKNIIPIMLSGFTEFPENLPADIAHVTRKNGPKYDEYYFDDFYHRLKTRFLATPIPTQVSHKVPNAQPANANAGALLHVHSDMECRIEKFGENLGIAAAGQYFPIRLRKGKHVLKFISTQDERDCLTITQIVEDAEMEDFIEVSLMPIKENRIARGEYVGETRNGLRWGKGRCVYPDGTIYEGEWKNDKRNGKGIFTYADGRRCEGEFVDDHFHIYINAANFPDDNFRKFLLEQDYGKEGVLIDDKIKRITFLNVRNKGIKNLKGVEFFTNLEGLDCTNNQLTVLDMSKNTELKILACSYNQLTELDLSKNTRLESLYCSANQFKTLHLPKTTELNSEAYKKGKICEILNIPIGLFNGLDVLKTKSAEQTSLDSSGNNQTVSSMSMNDIVGMFKDIFK